MKTLYTAILTLLFILTTTDMLALEVTIDRNPVRVNETFELTIHMDTAPVNQPELIGMPGDLEVLRNSNFYRKSTINGKANVQAGWRFTIKALNEGLFTIPSITLDGETTQPVTIKVLAAVSSTNINGQADAIRITSELSDDSVYVQQQLTYTIRLYRAVQAQYASLTEPELEGALIETLGDDVQFETMIDSVRYIVLERKYAIFPQKSGQFTITGVTYNAEVATGRQRFSTLGSLRGRSRSVSLSTEDKTVTVKPIPDGVTEWWLPAKSVSIKQKWQPEGDQIEIGSPVTWTYSLVADGLTATQIPDLLPGEVTGLKFYPEQAKESSQVIDGKMIGKRTQSVAVIATDSGKVTIPEMTVNWWNVELDKAQTVTIPAKTLIIDGDISPVKEPASPVVVSTDPKDNMVIENNPVNDVSKPDSNEQLLFWQIATAAMAVLWFITLLWKRQTAHKNTQPTTRESKNITSRQQKNKTATIKLISKAIDSGNLTAIQQSLIQFSRSYHSEIHSLNDITQHIKDPDLISAIKQLDASLYSSKDDSSWDSQLLKSKLKQLQLDMSAKAEQSRDVNTLEPMYPNHD